MNTDTGWSCPRSSLRRSLRAILMGAAAAWLTACGSGNGNSEPAAPAAVPASQSATQTLGSAGGSVVLNSSDGAVFSLEVPAGAFGAGTVVGLATANATPAQHFKLRLTPAGAVLAGGKQARLTITLPAGAAVPARGGLLYAGVPMAFTRLADGRLQVLLSGFADAPRVALAGRAHALAADPTGAICSPRLNADADGLTAEDAVEIELYGQCMVASVNALAQNAEYAAAVRMASVTAAYLQATGQGDPAGFIAQASRIACIAYRDALNHALVTPVTTMGTLYEVLKPVLFWESTRQRLGATCANFGEGDFIEVTNAKTDEAAAFYASKKGAIVDTSGVEYTEAAQEAKAGHDTIVQVRSLQPAPALAQVVTEAIEQRAQPSLLDAILQAPWQRCRDSGDYTELLRLWELMDGPQPVKDAIQYCATQIGAQARDANDAVSAVLSPGLGGMRVDLRNTSGSLPVNRDSKIELSGSIGALACPASDSEQLQLTFEDVEVATFASIGSVLLGADRPLPVLKASELLTKAGLRDDDSGTHALVVKRRNSTCATALGITDEVLATVALDFGAAALQAKVNYARLYSSAHDLSGVPPTEEMPFERYSIAPATPAALPFQFATNKCCAPLNSSIAVTLRDPKTIDFSSEFAMTAFHSLVSAQQFHQLGVVVTFARSGTVTMRPNPAWFLNGSECSYRPFVPGQLIINNLHSMIVAIGEITPASVQDSGGVYYPFDQSKSSGYSPCDVSVWPQVMGITRSQVDFQVTAGSRWQFYVFLQHIGNGQMTGSGTLATLHFEPTP